jgi:hypothetical protein
MYFRDVLFWTFTVFFILIGIVSLLSLMGYIKGVDQAFRKWAVTGFVAAVSTAVIGLFRLLLVVNPSPDIALFVTLRSDETLTAALVSGTYEYTTPGKNGGSLEPHKGPVEVTLGDGGWQAKLPQEVLDKAVQLTFTDATGARWTVPSFWPNFISRNLSAPSLSTDGHSATGQSKLPWLPAWPAVVLAAETGAESRLPPVEVRKATPKFNNYAKSIGQKYGRAYYQWRVFVDEPRSVLDTIQEVEYVLHPTFPEPLQVSTNRDTAFELINEGWGQFTILITVHFTDGTQIKTSYDLDLQKAWPVNTPPSASKPADSQPSPSCSPASTKTLAEHDIWSLSPPFQGLHIYVEEIHQTRPSHLITISTTRKVKSADFDWHDLKPGLKETKTRLTNNTYREVSLKAVQAMTIDLPGKAPLRFFVNRPSEHKRIEVGICK